MLQYAPRSRTERLIAAGRVVLAGFALFAAWLDPTEPLDTRPVASGLLVLYLAYAGGLAALAWRARPPGARVQLVTHAVDLVVFTVLMALTEGPLSPFFSFFVFSLAVAALRWQWRGTLWTALAALAAFVALAVYAAGLGPAPVFGFTRVLVRATSLVIVAALLGYLSVLESRSHAELARLAAWPASVPRDGDALLGEALAHAAATTEAPRVLLAWEDPEEPWLHMAAWSSRDGLRWTREAPDAYEPLVAPALAGSDFLCADAGAARPEVLCAAGGRIASWAGTPVHAALRARFAITAVMGSELAGKLVRGRLLVLDKPRMSADDLALTGIVARQVSARLDQFFLLEQLKGAAETEARIRLARDLHDGLLQSLTAAGLQLEATRGLLATDPAGAAERLLEVQRLLAAEQRDLRSLLRDLKPGVPAAAPDVGLPARLEEIRARLLRQWGLALTLEVDPALGRLPRELARDLHLVVHEAAVNAARHGGATRAEVRAALEEGRVRVVVVDNGRGFRFRGRREHADLAGEDGRPASLWSRVDALGGSLAVDSSEQGVRLEIALPLQRGRSPRAG